MKTRKRWNYGHWGNIGIADQSNETIRSYSCGYPIVVVTEEFKKMKLGCEKIIKQQKVDHIVVVIEEFKNLSKMKHEESQAF